MKRILILTYLLLYCAILQAQTYKFYYSDFPKFLKDNTTDTLKYPFSGGMNAPQFSNIDFNSDGRKDLFIFDRAANKVLTFTRTINGFVYTPQFEGRFPGLRNWALLKDYNNDGKEDLFTEISQNRNDLKDTVQAVYQNGLRIFRNISNTQSGLNFRLINNQIMDTGGMWGPPFNIPREAANVAINNSDIPAIEDLDNDGDLDILCYQGTSFTATYYDNFRTNKLNITYPVDTNIFILRDECWGYMQFDVNSLKNRFVLHLSKDQLGSCFFQMYGKKSRKHSGTAQLMLDINGDGVKDIIYADVGFNTLVGLINGRAQNSKGRDSIVSQDTLFPSNTTPADFVLFPAAYYADINDDGKGELLVTTNDPVGAKSTNNVWVYNNTGTHDKPVFNYAGNNFAIYDQTIDLGTRTIPVIVDIDGDGDRDLMVGTSGDFEKTKNLNDRIVWYENITSNTQPVFRLKDTNFLQLSKDTPIIQMHPVFADMNADGKPDLLCGDEPGNIHYYINTSTGTTPSFALQTRKLGNIDVGSHAAPAVYDLDKDNLPDLIVGNKGGILKYYKNTGVAGVPQFSSVPTIDSLGKVFVNESYIDPFGNKIVYTTGYAAPVLNDLDSNGKPELIVGSEKGNVYLYKDVAAHQDSIYSAEENIFVDFSSDVNGKAIRFGFRSAPFVGLLDGDNKADIIVGNIRGGLNFYASTNRGGPVPVVNETFSGPAFRLYPNPAGNEVTIGTENLPANVNYHFYDIMGKEVLTGEISRFYSEKSVNTENLKPGLYIIILENSGFKSSKKLVINR